MSLRCGLVRVCHHSWFLSVSCKCRPFPSGLPQLDTSSAPAGSTETRTMFQERRATVPQRVPDGKRVLLRFPGMAVCGTAFLVSYMSDWPQRSVRLNTSVVVAIETASYSPQISAASFRSFVIIMIKPSKRLLFPALNVYFESSWSHTSDCLTSSQVPPSPLFPSLWRWHVVFQGWAITAWDNNMFFKGQLDSHLLLQSAPIWETIAQTDGTDVIFPSGCFHAERLLLRVHGVRQHGDTVEGGHPADPRGLCGTPRTSARHRVQ